MNDLTRNRSRIANGMGHRAGHGRRLGALFSVFALAISGIGVASLAQPTSAGAADPCGSASFDVAATGSSIVLANGSDSWTGTVTLLPAGCTPSSTGQAAFQAPAAVTVSAVKDNGNGTYTATFKSSTPGSYSVSATYKSSPTATATDLGNQNISFLASGPDAAKSTISVTPTSATVPCGGSADITLSATVRDSQGTGVPGVEVTFTSSIFGAPVKATTNGSGVASLKAFSYPPSGQVLQAPKTLTFNATIDVNGTATPVSNSGATVTLTPASDCSSTLALVVAATSVSPVSANGADSWTASVTMKDYAGSPVTGQASYIGFTIDGETASVVRHSEVTETSAGVYQARFTSAVPGDYAVVAYYGTLTSGSKTITFVAPVPDAGKSSLTVTPNPAVIPCDGSAMPELNVTATIRDAAGNLLYGVPVTLTDNGTPSTVNTGIDGVASLKVSGFTQASAGTSRVERATVKVNGADIDVSGSPVTVPLNAASGCTAAPRTATANLSRTTQTVGGPIVATVTFKDVNGATITTLDPAKVRFTLASSTGVTMSPVTRNSDGTFSVVLTSATAGSYSLTALAYDATVFTLGTPMSFSFTAAPVGATLVADPVTPCAGKSSVVTLTLVDGTGAPFADYAVTFTVTGHATLDHATATTDANGVARVTVSDNVSEVVTVGATGEVAGGGIGNLASPTQVVFVSGCVQPTPVPDLAKSTLTMGPQSASMPFSVATATIVDSDGKPLAGVPVTFTTDAAAAWTQVGAPWTTTLVLQTDANGQAVTPTMAAMTCGGQPAQVHATVEVGGVQRDIANSPGTASMLEPILGSVCPAQTVTVTPTSGGTQVLADGVDSWTVTVTALDYAGTPVTGLPLADLFRVVGADATPANAPVTDAVTVSQAKELGNGRYSALLTSVVPGDYQVAWGCHLTAAPWCFVPLSFQPVPQPASGTLVVSPASSGSNLPVTATATVLGADGKPMAGVAVTFTTTDSGGARPTVAQTNAQGQASVQVWSNLTAWDACALVGTAQVSATVMIDGVATPLSGSPQTVTWTPPAGTLCPANVTFTVAPTSVSPVPADGVASWTGTVHIADIEGFPYTSYDLSKISFASVPSGVTASTVTNAGMGDYKVTFTSSTPGDFNVTVTVGDRSVTKTVSFVSTSWTVQLSADTYRPCAGGSAQVTLTAVPPEGSAIPAVMQYIKFTVSGQASVDPVVVPLVYVAANQDWEAQTAVSDTLAELVTVSAALSYGPDGAGGSPFGDPIVLTFVAGCGTQQPPPPEFSVTPSGGTPVLANGHDSYTGTITVRDTHGNLVTTLTNADFSFTLAPGLSASQVTKNADGTYKVTFTSTSAGLFPMTVTVAGYGPSATLRTMPFTASVPDAGKSTLVVVPDDPPLLNGMVSSPATVLATIVDSSGVPVEGVLVTFTTDANGTINGGSSATATTDAQGHASVKVAAVSLCTSSVVMPKGPAVVHATIGTSNVDIGGSPVTVTWMPAPPGSSCVGVEWSFAPTGGGTSVLADGHDSWTGTAVVTDPLTGARLDAPSMDLLSVRVTDSSGVPTSLVSHSAVTKTGTGTYTMTFTSSTPGSYQVQWSTGTVAPWSLSHTITFAPVPVRTPDPGKSTLEVVPSPMPVLGWGSPATVLATIVDASGQPLAGVEVTFTTDDKGTINGGSSAKATTDAQGHASVPVAAVDTCPSSMLWPAGNPKVHATVQAGGSPAEIGNSPVTVRYQTPNQGDACVNIQWSFAPTGGGTPVFADNVSSWTGTAVVTDPLTGAQLDAPELWQLVLDVRDSAGAEASAVTVSALTTLGSGVYSLTLKSSVPGTYTVRWPSGHASWGTSTIAFAPVSVVTLTVTAPANGARLTTGTPQFTGTATTGAIVTVHEGSQLLCSATADALGAWKCVSTVTLPDGPHVLTVDAVKNSVSAHAQVSVTVAATGPVVAVVTPVVERGKTQTITGSGWQAGELVKLTVNSTPIELGSVQVKLDGTLPQTTFTVPADFALGVHTVVAVGSVSGTHQTTFQVIAPVIGNTDGGGGTQVATGGSVAWTPWGVLLAVAVWSVGLIVLVSRRRARP